jgi:uncharacterized protein (TIGR02421 family)
MSSNRDKLRDLNIKAVEIAKTINLLGPIAWDPSLEAPFVESFEKGSPKLPEPTYPHIDHSDTRAALAILEKQLSNEDPLESFTKSTINSYIDATLMVEAVGKPEFQELSIKTYGKPGNTIPGSTRSNIAAAKKLLKISHGFEHPFIKEPEICVSAEIIADDIRNGIGLLGNDAPEIRIIPDYPAKATAGISTVKLRAGTCFSKYDAQQLLVHEVMTHTLTAINGSKQPILSVMGRGAPRTTSTQEGLATFSEVISGAIDLKRLIRIALRIVAIDRALAGADFIDTFKFFLKNGQSTKESFWSSARVFRGGDPKGGIIFTKDSVYLDGLLNVFALFQWALHENRPSVIHLLFCGRVTIEDTFRLEHSLDIGDIAIPTYIPQWYQNIESLAGNLAFSVLNTMVDLKSLKAHFNQIAL